MHARAKQSPTTAADLEAAMKRSGDAIDRLNAQPQPSDDDVLDGLYRLKHQLEADQLREINRARAVRRALEEEARPCIDCDESPCCCPRERDGMDMEVF